MEREVVFGRLLAIANVLGEKVFEKGKMSISQKYMAWFSKNPAEAFEKIHAELMEYAPLFGKDEMQLIEMFEEILEELNESDFTNEPLPPRYLHAYYSQQNVLNGIMGVEEASELWGLSPGTIKNYCAEGKVIAKKIGKTWIINKEQNNPSNHKQD